MISQTNLKTKTPFTVSLFWKSKQLQREIIFRRFKTFMLSYFYRRLIFRINLYTLSSTDLELHQNEPIICVFIVLCKNQSELYLCQGSPELFSPSVMRRREELWGRDCSCSMHVTDQSSKSDLTNSAVLVMLKLTDEVAIGKRMHVIVQSSKWHLNNRAVCLSGCHTWGRKIIRLKNEIANYPKSPFSFCST